MSDGKSRLSLVFKPSQEERAVSFVARARFAMLGAHSLSAISEESNPEIYSMLGRVSEKSGMPMPRGFIWHSNKPMANAVAMPSKIPTIALSENITHILNTEELEAVVGHELGHVKNMSQSGKLFWLAAFGGAAMADMVIKPMQRGLREQMVMGKGTSFHSISHMALTAGRWIAPVAAGAFASRSEEYAADRHGAYAMGGEAVPLLSALEKLGEHNQQQVKRKTSSLLDSALRPIHHLIRTHPTFEERRQAFGVTHEEIKAYQQATSQPDFMSVSSTSSMENPPVLEAPVIAQTFSDASRQNAKSWETRVNEPDRDSTIQR